MSKLRFACRETTVLQGLLSLDWKLEWISNNFKEDYMQASELKEIFIDELKDIYSAESQLLKA